MDIKGERDPKIRLKVIKNRLEFDEDPEAYVEKYKNETEELKQKLTNARDILEDVVIKDEIINVITMVAIKFDMEGHRADLAMVRAAKANAALDGRTEVTRNDIVDTAALVLKHRIKSGPFEEASFRQEDLRRWIASY